MNPEEQREPSQDELLAMAYVDGELDPPERAAFEARMTNETALRREVAELTRLGVLARQMTPIEPKDHEWKRLEAEPLHAGGTLLGFLASALGAVGVLGWLFWEVFASELPPLVKTALGLLLGGLLVVFLLIFRARLRTLPYDPYTEVER